MAKITHTVVKGDTLYALARKYNTTVADLQKLNNISNSNLIYVGQVLVISNDDGEVVKDPVTTSNTATIVHFGIQSNSESTIFATWAWDKEHTLEYEVHWMYDTGDGVWFIGADTTEKNRQSTYSIPSNAKRIRFVVRPVSETYKVNDQDTRYWVAGWSTEKIHDMSDSPPKVPPAPTVSIEDYTLTAELNDIEDLNADRIEFVVYAIDNGVAKVFNSQIINVVLGSATYRCTIELGKRYTACCRSHNGSYHSDWGKYSAEQDTKPRAPSGITECRATSKTSVYLEWETVPYATGYELEYTTESRYFDGSDQTTTISNIEFNHYEKTGLETGDEYFFRVRAVNDAGESSWSEPKSVIIGKAPTAPTTWSSTTTAMIGEPLALNWLHNAEDGSSQTYADIEIEINGVLENHVVDTTDQEDEDKTMHFLVDTSSLIEGAKIRWRVRTAGVTKEYGGWSIERYVDVYAPPSLLLSVEVSTPTRFPIRIRVEAGPKTQKPISYHLSVISDSIYETADSVGNVKMVNKGESIYSKHFPVSDPNEPLEIELSAGDIDLENNITYTILGTVSMDSGLTGTNSSTFTVAWDSEQYDPNAEISINKDSISAVIRPYCRGVYGSLMEGVTLSVYRREFDGGFTEIGSGIPNNGHTSITDPHPSLDFARYRIVARDDATGQISYYDLPAYPVGETSIVLQWDETWSAFDTENEDAMAQPNWAGSMLKLPYNVDVSDNYNMDVALVQYVGRKRPVSYYGTQLGESGSWGVEIPKTDVKTLYALRRLAVWTGDVYVREPSGGGFWANISVSFSQKHTQLTMPVTIDVTRVEGGA